MGPEFLAELKESCWPKDRGYLLWRPTGAPLPGTNETPLTLFFAMKIPPVAST